MSIFKQTNKIAEHTAQLTREANRLIREERRLQQYQLNFSIRDHLITEQQQDAIGSAEEIEQEPVRKGTTSGQKEMIAIVRSDKGQVFPTMARRSPGGNIQLSNNKYNFKKTVEKDQLVPLTDSNIDSMIKDENVRANLKRFTSTNPNKSLYLYAPQQGRSPEDKGAEWRLGS